jgi:hypothetical protein
MQTIAVRALRGYRDVLLPLKIDHRQCAVVITPEAAIPTVMLIAEELEVDLKQVRLEPCEGMGRAGSRPDPFGQGRCCRQTKGALT